MRWFRIDRGNALSAAFLVALAGVVLAAALAAEGYRTPRMDLHDGGVWISSTVDKAIGRTNTQIKQVDTKIPVQNASDHLDLMQSDAVVLVHQDGAGSDSLFSIEGRTATPANAVKLPPASLVGLGPPTATDRPPAAAVLDQDGHIWVGDSSAILNLKFGTGKDDTKPSGTVEAARDLVVGLDGVARVYSPRSGQVTSFDETGRNLGATSVADKRDNNRLQFSSVGSTPVVLDQTARELLVPGHGPIDLRSFGEHPVLQQPGPASSGALVATDVSLLRVPLAGGAPEKLFENGSQGPARPVYVRGCAFGAWSGSPAYVRTCDGYGPKTAPLPGLLPGKAMTFRTNRGKVVINELEDGKSFIINDANAEPVDWSQAITEDQKKPDPNAVQTKQEDTQAPDPIEKPPKANPDFYATRPDRAVVVHPLENDTDPNHDVLVIESVDNVPDGARVEIVDGGLALQVTPAPGSLDTISFGYTINDGRGGTDHSTVTVEIHRLDVNHPPTIKPGRSEETFVVAGASVTHNVLTDYIDPDGDSISLDVPIQLDSSKGTVTADPNGLIVYTPPGTGFLGDITIPFTVRDDHNPSGATAGSLLVHVLPADHSNLPKLRGDHAIAVVGHEVVVDVLANDSDADGDPLRVIGVDQPAGTTVTVDAQNRVHVIATSVGVFNLQYSVTDGPHVAKDGLLRVDVIEEPVQKPPIAVRDDVVLLPGVPAISDVLQNDIDPNGDVLIVLTVNAGTTGLVVEVIDHRFLRITTADGGILPETKSFTYTVSDGGNQAIGTVVVRPGPTSSQDQPPHTVDDDVSVRAGNIATFDVLANDSDPEGGHLSLLPPTKDELAQLNLADRVFEQHGMLRFIAPTEPATYRIPYSAADPGGNRTAAFVVVHVLPADLANNGPKPPDLNARTVAGRPIDIPVPVATMDPDGDDVTLLGVADTAPKHGSITGVGLDRLTYLPDKYDGGFYGTDTFTYRVRDSKGAEATGTIRVGVAPPATFNSKPVAIDDVRQVSAGGVLSVDVVRNDSDPDGDRLALDTNAGLGLPPGSKFTASIQDGRVLFNSGGLKQGDEASITYTVTDGILTDRGLLKVRIAPQENLPPIAQDDQDVAHPAGQIVTFDVLKNDSDPDGSANDLHITDVSGLSGATTTSGGQKVTFTMPDHAVDLVYTVADAQGATARAVLRVPVLDNVRLRPVANYDEDKTDQAKPVTVDVLANDTTSPGTSKKLLDVGNGRGGTCVDAGDGKVTFTPLPDFVGIGGCTYTLGDGPGDAPETLRSIGMVGITVKRAGNTAPTFVEQPLTVTANSETKIDLRPAASDPDDGDLQRLTFSDVKGETDVVSASFDGSVITVRAKSNAVDGTIVKLMFTVSDGHPNGTATGTVNVTVTEFKGGLAVLAPDTVQTFQGIELKSIPVLANDQRAENNDPLKIVTTSGTPAGTVTFTDTDVSFAPNPDFHGDTTFTYTVDDGTGQLKRQVIGTVTVTVIGRPDRPPAPSVTRESGAITLNWGVPAANGAPITSYSIKVSGGSVSGASTRTSSSNSFRFDGLTNGQTYTFQIAAINTAVDAALQNGKLTEPEYSPPSQGIIPNAIPPVPNAPTAKFDPAGNAITVTWTDPGGQGTPVTRYVLQISPPPNGGSPEQSFQASGSTMTQTIGNLTNGTPYTFKVKAINQLSPTEEGDSGFSSASAQEVPASKPDAPAQPMVSNKGDQNLTVTWVQPNTNGDAIRSYDVEVTKSGAVVGVTHIADPSVRQAVITTTNGADYTFRVLATNKAGDSPYSAPSVAAKSYGTPLAIPNISADVDSVSSNQAKLTFGPAPDNGDPITYYESSTNGGGWVSAGSASQTIIVNGLANGSPYTFRVHGCNNRGCAVSPSQDGPTSNPPVIPYGAPFAPTVNSSVNGTTINWNWNQPPDNGRSFTRFDVYLDGALVQQGGATSYSKDFGAYSQSHGLAVYVIASANDPNRTTSSPGTNSNTTGPAPCSNWTVYGQNQYGPDPVYGGGYGATIRATTDRSSAAVGSVSANAAVTIDYWTTGTTPFPNNPYPYNGNQWLHVASYPAGTGFVNYAAVRAAPALRGSDGGPALLPPACQR